MNSDPTQKALHDRLSELLDASACPNTATWFNNYLKGAITYRGLKTPALKNILQELFRLTSVDQLPPDTQLDHIRFWLAAPMAEDKLTAILWLKQWLTIEARHGDPTRAVMRALDLVESTFAAGDIDDWSTNDWLCVRVLETMPIRYPIAIERLMGWVNADSVWQRRSSLLAFKKAAKIGHFHSEVERLIARLLPSDARFIQTAVGWVLSDLSRHYAQLAGRLFETHFDELSHEVIVRHTKHLPNHQELKQRSRRRPR